MRTLLRVNCNYRNAVLYQVPKLGADSISDKVSQVLGLHVNKKAIRVLGIAESFKSNQKFSTLAGVVMRSDLVIDGFGLERLRVQGSDATGGVVRLFQKLRRNDINAILTSGSVLSLYNVLDISKIESKLNIPVISLSFKKSTADLAANIRNRFSPAVAKRKIALLEKLGEPDRVLLKTGYSVFTRAAGAGEPELKRLLDKFTLQGAIPEPIRVARLLAKTVASLK